MNAETNVDIVSGHRAKQALAHFTDNPQNNFPLLWELTYFRCTISVRPCYQPEPLRWEGSTATYTATRTGGYVVSVSVADPDSVLDSSRNTEYRVRAGYEGEKLRRALSRAIHRAQVFGMQQASLRNQRTLLLHAVERAKLPDDLDSWLAGHAPRPFEYAAMNAEDCEYWQSVVSALPAKT